MDPQQYDNEVPEPELSQTIAKLQTRIESLEPLLRDFSYLESSKPLFERSPYTYLSNFAKEIKAEVLKELLSRLSGPLEALNSQQTAAELAQQRISSLSESIDKAVIDRAHIYELLSTADVKLEEISDQVLSRATFKEFSTLAEKLSQKADISIVEGLEQKLEGFSTVEALKALGQQLSELGSQLSARPSREELTENSQKLSEALERRLKIEDFQENNSLSLSEFTQIHALIEENSIQQEKANLTLKREVSALARTIEKRPWNEELKPLENAISSKVPASTFEERMNSISPLLTHFTGQIEDFTSEQVRFERILERYDELLTDKASKDDMQLLAANLTTLLPTQDFDAALSQVHSELRYIHSHLQDQHIEIRDSNKNLTDFNEVYKSFKREMRNFYQLYNTLSDLKASLESKADKSKLIELASQKDSPSTVHRQLELVAALLVECSKTMLKSSETTATKEFYRNTNSLYHWVSGHSSLHKSTHSPLALPNLEHSRHIRCFSLNKVLPC